MQNYLNRFLLLSRRNKIALQFVTDAALVTLCFFAAMFFTIEDFDFAGDKGYLAALLSSIIASLITFWVFGLYSVVIRFITGKILLIVAKGAAVEAICLYAAGLFWDIYFPQSTPILFTVFTFLAVGGLRFGVRTYVRNNKPSNRKPVIIYGAGEAGLQLLNALFYGHEYLPVALVDDDTALKRLSIGGLSVYSPDKITSLISKTGAKLVLLAMPGMSHGRRREILSDLTKLPIEIKTIPRMSDIMNGKAQISELQTVTADDLLGREPILPDAELLNKNISQRVVMVTGAGGSIGSELCRQILTQMPSVLILFDVSEFALYKIDAELKKSLLYLQLKTRIVPVLGSVQNGRQVEVAIKAFKVQTIFHAAAYKHVPLVEQNIVEGVQNNVFGTLTITRAAQKLGVENFILVSTDKAVRPTNIMGATKRLAELICQALALEGSATVFSMVRFGNVLDSSGSVIPLFRSQIEAGGPITVTHRDITRYFMTISEAAQLVIQAGALGRGGDVFVLDMGKPLKIIDLALSMVKLHGLIPYIVEHEDQVFRSKGDIPICITGLRKGEKLFEELLIGNNPEPTKHPRIMTASEVTLPRDVLMVSLDCLHQACEAFNLRKIISILDELPLGYAPMTREISDQVCDAD